MRFYLGTHEPSWLGRVRNVPLFVSHRRLVRQKTWTRATTPWALDSGGFTELNMHGRWTVGVDEYVEAVSRYDEEIGHLEWASPQDWMCEDFVLEKTGLTVRDYQEKTVQSVLDLRPKGPYLGFAPVLQGQTIEDYLFCIELYIDAGIDLWAEPVVGVGSVCRRQATTEILALVSELSSLELELHGFGVKTQGLKQYGPMLTSADSMAWSFRARMLAQHQGFTMPGCRHKACNNCLVYALHWRERTLAAMNVTPQREVA